VRSHSENEEAPADFCKSQYASVSVFTGYVIQSCMVSRSGKKRIFPTLEWCCEL